MKRQALGQACAFADCKFAAHPRPAVVDPAQHRDPVHSGAPAVIEAFHDLSAPPVRCDEFGRRIVVAHQDDFQLAATGSTGGAGNRPAAGGSRICWIAHCTMVNAASPCIMTPIFVAAAKPSDLKMRSTSSAVSGAHATSRPPEVCGSVTRLRFQSAKSAGHFTSWP